MLANLMLGKLMLGQDSRLGRKGTVTGFEPRTLCANISFNEPNVRKANVRKANVRKANVRKPNVRRAKLNVRTRNLMLGPDLLTLASFANIRSAGAQISDAYRGRSEEGRHTYR